MRSDNVVKLRPGYSLLKACDAIEALIAIRPGKLVDMSPEDAMQFVRFVREHSPPNPSPNTL